MRIYIACALSHVPRDLFDEYTKFIHALAAALNSQQDHQVKYALVNSDPQLAEKPENEKARLCYLWDREMVEEADLVIGEASFPSIGLGIELQIAAQKDTPVVLCFRNYGMNRAAPVTYSNPDHSQHQLQIGKGYVSLMALGLPSLWRSIQYGTEADGIRDILEAVSLLKKD